MTLLTSPPVAAFPGRFDPFAFFQGRTLGHAAVRLPGGKLLRRCVIETAGEGSQDYDSLHFDEAYVYDDGSPADLMHWAVTRSGDEFQASELSVLSPVRSRLTGCEWRLNFTRRAEPPSKGPLLRYDVRFTQVTPDVVTKTVRLSLFGVPVATMLGYHQRVEG